MKLINRYFFRRLGCGAGGLLLLACLSGCAFKGGGVEPGLTAEDAWEPRPVSMRVYPSTRFAMRDGEAVLEARVELLDEMGDPIKGAGVFVLELFASERPGGPTAGRQLYAWRAPMLTLEQQQQFFDSITRTYLLRLELDDPDAAQRATLLNVTFAPVGGEARLEAEAVLGEE